MVGVRFCHGGRTAQGVDCIGLLTVVYASVGVLVQAPDDYPKRPAAGYTFTQASQFADRIDGDAAGPGDIVQMIYGNAPVHFGIITENGKVVHSAALNRQVVENSLPKTGNGRAIAFWRIKGVTPWHS